MKAIPKIKFSVKKTIWFWVIFSCFLFYWFYYDFYWVIEELKKWAHHQNEEKRGQLKVALFMASFLLLIEKVDLIVLHYNKFNIY